jgi:hypothetical protein
MGVDLDLDDNFIHMTNRRTIKYGLSDTFDGLYVTARGWAVDGHQHSSVDHRLAPWPSIRPTAYINKSSSGVWKASGQEIVDW